MKVKIAYLPGEEQEAESLHNCAKELLKPVKVNRSDRHAPYRHIYIATEKQATEKQPDTPCKKENNVV